MGTVSSMVMPPAIFEDQVMSILSVNIAALFQGICVRPIKHVCTDWPYFLLCPLHSESDC